MSFTVSQVARLSKLSVRALHHYDEIGLLRPSGRSPAGYRLYAEQDLEKLQQILFFRALGFPLEEIRRVVNERSFDVVAALRMQRELLAEKVSHLKGLLRAVDEALAAHQRGEVMESEKRFEAFDPSKYEAEAEERWGDTDAYKESKRRTKQYGKAEWEKIKAEGEANLNAFAALFDQQVPATDPRAMDAAENARLHIDRWFYPCSRTMHRALGEMYVQDERFTATYDRVRSGLAKYVRDAIAANAER